MVAGAEFFQVRLHLQHQVTHIFPSLGELNMIPYVNIIKYFLRHRFGMETHLCGICWGWDLWPTVGECTCRACQCWKLSVCTAGKLLMNSCTVSLIRSTWWIWIWINCIVGHFAGRSSWPIQDSWGGHYWCDSASADMLLSWSGIYPSRLLR